MSWQGRFFEDSGVPLLSGSVEIRSLRGSIVTRAPVDKSLPVARFFLAECLPAKTWIAIERLARYEIATEQNSALTRSKSTAMQLTV